MAIVLTFRDFLTHGLPSQALSLAMRPIRLADSAANTLWAPHHGVLTGDLVTVDGQGTLPTGLARGVVYRAQFVDIEHFSLVHITGPFAGLVVDLQDAGTPPIVYRVDPRPIIESALAASWQIVNDSAKAYGELTDAPEQMRQDACVIAAYQLVVMNRIAHTLNKDDIANLEKRAAYAYARCKVAATGVPIKNASDSNAQAEMGARASLVQAPIAADWGAFQ